MEENLTNKTLVKNWLKKSSTALKDASKNIEIKSYETAQNRLYYAIFYAVSALAKSENFITSKHTQLLGWFNLHYIKTNKIDKNTASIYRTSFENRQKSDYTFYYVINKKELQQDIEKAKIFVSEIKKILKRNEVI